MPVALVLSCLAVMTDQVVNREIIFYIFLSS